MGEITAIIAAILIVIVSITTIYLGLRLTRATHQTHRLRIALTREKRLRKSLETQNQHLLETLDARDGVTDQMHHWFSETAQKVLDHNRAQLEKDSENRKDQQTREMAFARERQLNDLSSTLQPVKALLSRYEKSLEQLQADQQSRTSAISTQIASLSQSTQAMRDEANRLSTALRRAPRVSGKWGELQLRNIVEHAGLSLHTDFIEQLDLKNSDTSGRPDMVVRLPNDRWLAIDAKCSLDAYFRAIETDDTKEKTQALNAHARALHHHIEALAKRNYHHLLATQYENSPDLVILFVPGDAPLSLALEQDPQLFETALSRNIILASPLTLVAILKGLSLTWQEASLSSQASEIIGYARHMLDELQTLTEDFDKLGRSLTSTVKHYNGLAGKLETGIHPALQKIVGHSHNKLTSSGTKKSGNRLAIAPTRITQSLAELETDQNAAAGSAKLRGAGSIN